MDVISATGGGGGGAGPAPFLLKTYEMVDDSQTDDIVSWNQTGHSFVVWNPPEFARILLPTYFKHNNFSSFIRQLNTYGFRKIDPERWEFANEEFMRDQKHLLKNIHRRKPIHSHSHPPGSTVDPERAAFEEEIHNLSREKSGLEDNILRFRQQHSGAKLHLNELTERVGSIEQRQENLLAFVEKAVQNPVFVERLAQKLESMDISAFSKKRRLPQVDGEDNISVGSLSHQDFSNKLRLELSPAVSDINVVSCSTQSSTEDGGGSPHRRIVSEGDGWSRENLISNEEVDGHILCQLNLSLASLPSSQMDKNQYSVRVHQIGQEIGADDKNHPNDNKKISSLHDETPGNKASTTQVRVNDVFWEQFLTEKPGCSDNEEASSSFRGNSYDEIDEKKSNQGVASNTRKVEHLTL